MANATRRSTGLRLLLEGLVVLVSILAAFFLEGWRDDRELARELEQELASVGRELDRNRELVLAEVAAINRIVAGTDALLGRLEANDESRFIAVSDSLAWLATLWGPTLDPSLGAVDALISSGRLALIDNPDLRLGLAGLRDVLADAAAEQQLALQLSFDRLYPLVLGSPDMSALRRVSREFTTVRQEAGLSPQEQMAERQMPTYTDIAYPNEVAIRSVLNLKLVWYEAAIAELHPLLPHLDNLMSLVAEEIG